MKKSLLILVLLLTIPLDAQSPGKALLTGTSQQGILASYNSEAITIDATAGGVGFTASKISPTCTDCSLNILRAVRADCVTEPAAANIRVTIDATTVTTTVGTLIAAGTSFTIYGYANIANFKAIRTAAVSVAMYCVYSRPS